MEFRKHDKNRRVWDIVGRFGSVLRAPGDQLIVIGGPRAHGERLIEMNACAPKTDLLTETCFVSSNLIVLSTTVL